MASIKTECSHDKKLPGLQWERALKQIFNNSDPLAAIQSGKVMAKAWIKTLPEHMHTVSAQTFMLRIVEAYWKSVHVKEHTICQLPVLFELINIVPLDKSVESVAEAVGYAAASLPVITASHLLGNFYTSLLPESTRTTGGIFYTPPVLTARLIQLATNAGVNWATARVVDPACGGGAFLTPICLKMLDALGDKTPLQILCHIQDHLEGWEIDPFAGWLTQIFVEVVLKEVLAASGSRLAPLVKIGSSLESSVHGTEARFDLVIGNPPYGKLKLTDKIRDGFRESLYGHPNLYGLFTHLALTITRNKGVVALLTPTSFLSGEYFKQLRQFIRQQSTIHEIDFVSLRKGVFEDVLQETMLAAYQKGIRVPQSVRINQITTLPNGKLKVHKSAKCLLPQEPTAPWIFPRTPAQSVLVMAMQTMKSRLLDYGYTVSTGPLVWNRHKLQLVDRDGNRRFPIVWAESITSDGQFILRAEKKNHTPFFHFEPGDDWLIVRKPCILLQRTTAKEQDKRLIAAALPTALLERGVVVENHLNMIMPVTDNPLIPSDALAAFLNSKIVNDAFRTISGSVAVSAYELESLPLPSPDRLKRLIQLVKKGSSSNVIEKACEMIYTN